jgi:catechol 2,3-dioxygenase-like lactoylglutathione lyase family enzyme
MFRHVTIRVADRAASEGFYRTVLATLDIHPTDERADLVVWDDYMVIQADAEHKPTQNLHVAFVASTCQQVDDFWQTGVDAGWQDAGAPGERPRYKPDYYGAFLFDPDGNSVEAVHHGDTRPGGNVDHLWVGVRDLDAAETFYNTIARYTGLREGSKWEQGVQFRGAWATFSLVGDGRAPTERLHMAFPAPDRATVEKFHEAAIAAGYRDNGGPGERPQYGDGYFAAFILDADGTNVESVHGSSSAIPQA